ncbi:hypothetical protein NPIL_245651 [Nephila pilipes]|uniref:Uncharacterized protein n=1 Tax=Nephila pilipes TaxID=299642 RepID=A0A8X6NXS9_NEPPI|nr:hypothetical protein NPIL_245651 [Nephila pilipes]
MLAESACSQNKSYRKETIHVIFAAITFAELNCTELHYTKEQTRIFLGKVSKVYSDRLQVLEIEFRPSPFSRWAVKSMPDISYWGVLLVDIVQDVLRRRDCSNPFIRAERSPPVTDEHGEASASQDLDRK